MTRSSNQFSKIIHVLPNLGIIKRAVNNIYYMYTIVGSEKEMISSFRRKKIISY